MKQDTDAFIAGLVADLQPVEPLSFARGLGYALMGAVVLLMAVLGRALVPPPVRW